jgi:hypothetical protein
MRFRMAIIDSGINPFHPHVNGVAGGVSFRMDENQNIIQDPDFSDEIGHGTAIAGIVRAMSPLAEIYAVKIFLKKLSAPGALLLTALEWAITNKMEVIHLSLGTERKDCKEHLRRLCREAFNNNIIIVAAGRGPDDGIFPAALPEVVGVYWNRQCRRETIICHPGCNIEFGAYGRPRDLPGIPEDMNFSGHSFAAAQITARIAALLESHPQADVEWVREQLVQQAVTNES